MAGETTGTGFRSKYWIQAGNTPWESNELFREMSKSWQSWGLYIFGIEDEDSHDSC